MSFVGAFSCRPSFVCLCVLPDSPFHELASVSFAGAPLAPFVSLCNVFCFVWGSRFRFLLALVLFSPSLPLFALWFVCTLCVCCSCLRVFCFAWGARFFLCFAGCQPAASKFQAGASSVHPIILRATHVDWSQSALSCWGLLQERQLLWRAQCVFFGALLRIILANKLVWKAFRMCVGAAELNAKPSSAHLLTELLRSCLLGLLLAPPSLSCGSCAAVALVAFSSVCGFRMRLFSSMSSVSG